MLRTQNLLSVMGLARAPAPTRERRMPASPDPSPVAYAAAPRVEAALRAIGRTEDIQFSPDDSKLAICGFIKGSILVLDVERGDSRGRVGLRFPRHVELASAAFRAPHGVAWLDGATLAVANREGEVVLIRLPEAGATNTTNAPIQVEPLATIHTDAVDGLEAPGSIAAIELGGDRFEILVCNNDGHTITSHIVATGRAPRVESSVRLLQKGLVIPDSIALAPRARWLAISNHHDHSVFLYRNVVDLKPESPPVGTLRGVLYPHGLRFSADGRRLFLADAGLPFVHVYESDDGDWRGTRYPEARLAIMDDDTYVRGRKNPEEGGPKGLDLTRDDAILVATCDEVPFVCFDVRGLGQDARRPERTPRALRTTPPVGSMPVRQVVERHRRNGAHGAAVGGAARAS